jgi:cell division protein FtsB
MVLEKLQQLPAWLTNKYLLVGLAFAVWMLFFDRNNLLLQYQRKQEQAELIDKKAYYEREIEQIRQDKEELFSTNEKLEKFAREKYHMKKPQEDIFIIVEKE